MSPMNGNPQLRRSSGQSAKNDTKTVIKYRIPRLHDVVDDLESLRKVSEGALYRVDGNPLEVIESPAEGVGALGELAGH